MKNWMRIILFVFVSIGGTMSFGLWSLHQFDGVFEELSASSYVAISPSFREHATIATTTSDIATSTATTTDTSSTIFPDQDDVDPKLTLVFTPKENRVYIGCTYKISWLASTTVTSLGTILIDGGTREPSGPIASGLARTYEPKPDAQSIDWKVGAVWPGEYYIEVSKANNIEAKSRSAFFQINKMPAEISEEEKINTCRASGGL